MRARPALLLVLLARATTAAAPSALAAGTYHTCATRDGGALAYCWGLGTYGMLAQGDSATRGDTPADMGVHLPVAQFGDGGAVAQVAVGAAATCVRLVAGGVKCVGLGAFAQLGYGDLLNRGDTPDTVGDKLPLVSFVTPVLGATVTPVWVALGVTHTCVLLQSSLPVPLSNNRHVALRCYGAANYGELGLCDDGAFTSTTVLQTNTAVPYVDISNFTGGSDPTSVHAGNGFTCLFSTVSGAIACFGRNDKGQLGRGHAINIGGSSQHRAFNLTGVPVNLTAPALELSVGAHHSCAILSSPTNGAVVCWGSNDQGRLGLGDVLPRGTSMSHMGAHLPHVDLGTGRSALRVSAGGSHTCVVLDTRRVMCWGRGEILGIGGVENRGELPLQMGNFAPLVDLGVQDGSNNALQAADVACGSSHTCVQELSTDRIKCFGDNFNAQCGMGDLVFRGNEPNEMGNNLTFVNVVRCSLGRFDDGVNGCQACTNAVKWCGLGATRATHVEEGEHVEFESVIAVPAMRGKRTVMWRVRNVSPRQQTIQIAQSQAGFPSFVEGISLGTKFMDAVGLDIAPNATAAFRVTISDVGLDRTQPVHVGVVAFSWLLDGVPSMLPFYVTVNISLASLIVTPSHFSYRVKQHTAAGPTTSGEGDVLVPAPQVNVFNTLCSSAVNYTVEWCDAGDDVAPWLLLEERGAIITMDADAAEASVVHFSLDRSAASSLWRAAALARASAYNASSVEAATRAITITSCLAIVAHYGGRVVHPVTIAVEVEQDCPLGYFSATGRDTAGCIPCALNTYADEPGSTQCLPCPDRLPLTLAVGSRSSAQCVAAPGYVHVVSGRSNTSTVLTCPRGANCTASGLTLETLPLLPGWWRSGPRSREIVPCDHPQYCVGGFAHCAPRHTGVMCESCALASDLKRGDQLLCQPCTADDAEHDRALAGGIMLGFVVCLLAFAALVHVVSRHTAMTTAEQQQRLTPAPSSRMATAWYRDMDFAVKARQIIGHFQIMGASVIGFGAYLPDEFRAAYAFFAVLGLNVMRLVDFGCGLPQQPTHYTSLLATTLLPVGFVVVLFTIRTAMIVRRRWCVLATGEDGHLLPTTPSSDNNTNNNFEDDVFVASVLFFVFLIYPSTSSIILQTFACERVDQEDVAPVSSNVSLPLRYLRADPSLSCDTSEYNFFFAYAIVTGLIYVAGIPLAFAKLLWDERRALSNESSHRALVVAADSTDGNSTAHRIRFLWLPYRSTAYWFEVSELVRRLMQVAVLVLVPGRDSPQPQIALLLVTVGFIVVLQAYKPYRARGDGHIAVTSQVVIALVAFLSLLQQVNSMVRSATATTNADVGSSNQLVLFDSDALTGALIACLVFLPVVVLGQMALDAWQWRERRWRTTTPPHGGTHDRHHSKGAAGRGGDEADEGTLATNNPKFTAV